MEEERKIEDSEESQQVPETTAEIPVVHSLESLLKNHQKLLSGATGQLSQQSANINKPYMSNLLLQHLRQQQQQQQKQQQQQQQQQQQFLLQGMAPFGQSVGQPELAGMMPAGLNGAFQQQLLQQQMSLARLFQLSQVGSPSMSHMPSTPGMSATSAIKSDTLTTSVYRGVSWHKRDARWLSRIWINKKIKHLGLFRSEKMAALAFDLSAIAAYEEDQQREEDEIREHGRILDPKKKKRRKLKVNFPDPQERQALIDYYKSTGEFCIKDHKNSNNKRKSISSSNVHVHNNSNAPKEVKRVRSDEIAH